MNHFINFIFSPGGENEGAAPAPDENEDQKEIIDETPADAPEVAEEKPLIEKIKEALQDWSNKDELDQEFDDTRV